MVSARLVLPGSASEAEWLKARRDGITASEIAVIMGLSPYSSPYALYWQKLGHLPGQDDNLAMALGRHLEDFVAGAFRDRSPLHIWGDGRALYAHPEQPWQLATPDRLLFEDCGTSHCQTGGCTCQSDPVAVLECKTYGSYDGWGEDGSDEIPVHYRCQVLWQMDVMGVTAGYVACLFLHSRQLRVYELALDDRAQADLELMRKEAQAFRQRLFFGRVPGVDWRPATHDALRHLHPSLEDRDVYVGRQLVISYRAACRDLKAAEQRRKLAENRIRERLGSGRRAVDPRTGDVVATRQVYDVKEHVRSASHVDKLVIAKLKEPKP